MVQQSKMERKSRGRVATAEIEKESTVSDGTTVENGEEEPSGVATAEIEKESTVSEEVTAEKGK